MLSDPIVALATPAGRSALAVVRLSGSGAFEVAAAVVPGFRTDRPRHATLARFHDHTGDPIDQGLYTVFPAPASYTGDDLIEFSCHGGLVAPARLIAALQSAGARPAAPGEFTRRAVLNGKLDLVQAEAVGDLIDATAPAQARAALQDVEGGLSSRLAALRAELVDVLALLDYGVDFPEEDEPPHPPDEIAGQLVALGDRIARLVETASSGERLREGALIVLAGRPNAGKSSLFNALLGTARALVAAVPGTTRDTIEAHTDFLGWPVRLADTAGLWEAPGELDRLGVAVARRYLAAADLVLLCVEAGRDLGDDERTLRDGRPTLLVRTKADLVNTAADELAVSVVTGAGLDLLRRSAAERVFAERMSLADLEPALTRARHRDALARARLSLERAVPHLCGDGDVVLAAYEAREAATALDELLGAVDVEEVLDRIFASFCVGK